MNRLNRRTFVKSIAAGSATLAVGKAGCAADESSTAPSNLVFVMCDQMRAHAQGFMNEDPVITPNLDRFSKESLVLTQAVSTAPVCSPYRAMLMTGKYPISNKVISNCTSRSAVHGIELQESDRCWSDVLDDHDYSLGYIGKWHLEGPHEPFVKSYNNRPDFAWNEWTPPRRRHGFDFWYAYNTFDMHNRPEYWSTNMTRDERVKVDQWGPEHEADLAIEYLENERGKYRKPDQPFALVVSMNPPHTPYNQVPKRYVEMYADKTPEELTNRPNVNLKADTKGAKLARAQIKNYFAMVTGVDEQFGRIVKAIEENGLAENTIVVFTSDHGNCLGCHDQPTKNNHYEESMRVPFMIRWPGKIPARHDDLLLGTPDIMPTLLGLMGRTADIPKDVEGTSFAPLFLGGEMKRPESQLYFRAPFATPEFGERGVRTHRYTLVINKRAGNPPVTVLRDNQEDPFQLKDVAGAQPEVVRQLVRDHLVPWLIKTKDPWLRT